MKVSYSCSRCENLNFCRFCDVIVECQSLEPSDARIVAAAGCSTCCVTSRKKIFLLDRKIADLENTVKSLKKQNEELANKNMQMVENQNHKFFENDSIAELNDELAKKNSQMAFLKLNTGDDTSFQALEGDVKMALGTTKRSILAEKSPVFSKMLEVDMIEKESGIIRIPDTTLPVIRAVYNFCKTAEIIFSEEVPVYSVLELAHKYDIGYLRQVCGEEYIKSITKENAAEMARLAAKFDVEILGRGLSEVVKENFDEIFPDVFKAMIDTRF